MLCTREQPCSPLIDYWVSIDVTSIVIMYKIHHYGMLLPGRNYHTGQEMRTVGLPMMHEVVVPCPTNKRMSFM